MESNPATIVPESLFAEEQAVDADEAAYWENVERKLRLFCDPLSRAIRPKNITWAMQFSQAQLSKELSGTDDKHLSARVLLYIARKSQHDELCRYIVCDLLGFKMPERQRPPTLAEELADARSEIARLKGLMRAGLDREPDAPSPVKAVPR